MKKVLIIACVTILLLALVACTQNGDGNSIDVLSVMTETELEEYIEKEDIEIYSFSVDMAYIGGVTLFDTESEIEFYMRNDAVTEMDVIFPLFQIELADVSEPPTEETKEEILKPYVFTDGEKSEIQSAFQKVKKGFEEYVGGTLESYDIIPTHDMEILEDNDDAFYAGEFVKEYSVRDRNGTLWILRYEASYGFATAVLYKMVDETGFEGFIPGVDLTKNK